MSIIEFCAPSETGANLGEKILKNYIFTSESVTEGHPDKMADGISDTILDALLTEDPDSRVACETLVNTGLVVIAGEISSNASIDFQKLARQKIKRIGYDHSNKGFDCDTCSIMVTLDKQSSDIAQGVNLGEGLHKEQGAGDQGLMFGYAVNETENYMPLSIELSHKLASRLSHIRKEGISPEFRPDGKTQVSVEYSGDKVMRLKNILVSTQHSANLSLKQIEEIIQEEVIKKVIPQNLMDKQTKIWVNPTGKFIIGGPQGDCGLTGRKIIVDTYGGHGAHGGGAFSGKDPSKVDRSAAYAARHVAKHIVAAGLAEKALVQVSYAIGVASPMSFCINTFGTEKVDSDKLTHAVNSTFDMKPASIIKRLNLMNPIYEETSAYGHFGRDIFSWEKLGQLDELKSHF